MQSRTKLCGLRRTNTGDKCAEASMRRWQIEMLKAVHDR
jgi:hypothetical protein